MFFSRFSTNVMILLSVFVWGYLVATYQHNEATTIKGLETQITSLERQIEAQKQDAVLLRQSEQELAHLNLKIQEMQDALSDKDRVCFDDADARRLRNIWPDPSTSSRCSKHQLRPAGATTGQGSADTEPGHGSDRPVEGKRA